MFMNTIILVCKVSQLLQNMAHFGTISLFKRIYFVAAILGVGGHIDFLSVYEANKFEACY